MCSEACCASKGAQEKQKQCVGDDSPRWREYLRVRTGLCGEIGETGRRGRGGAMRIRW